MNIKRQLYSSYHLGNSKDLRSSVPEMGTKTKYIHLFINHNVTDGERAGYEQTRRSRIGPYLYHNIPYMRSSATWALVVQAVWNR